MVSKLSGKQLVLIYVFVTCTLLLIVYHFALNSTYNPKRRHVQTNSLLTQCTEEHHRMDIRTNKSLPKSHNSTKNYCHRNVVYVKVHKAASSTMNQILLRYGISRKKKIAIPKRAHFFDFKKLFHRGMVFDKPSRKSELLFNHARYNRPEMNAIVPNALYVASVREPVSQFESCFGYFRISKQITGDQFPTKESMETFMSEPKKYLKNISYGDYTMWNGQLFDLGFEKPLFKNHAAIHKKIKELDKEFDLILISEHFDESLILLKNLLCLDFRDILYLPANVRSNIYKTNISIELSRKIKAWNSADVMLYEHFNNTLWRKINQQGPEFWDDLKTFQKLKDDTIKQCVNYTNSNVDQRLWKQILNDDVPRFCRNLTQSTVRYVNDLRQSLSKKRS